MAATGTVLTDSSILSRLDLKLVKLERIMALLSGLAVFSLMILAVVSVSGRNFYNQPLPGYVDWIEQAMPLIAFLGVAYVQREGGHIRMDILISGLRGRPLWIIELITVMLMLLLMVLLVWGSWSHFGRSADVLTLAEWPAAISAGDFGKLVVSRDSSIDIALPLWPAKLIVPLAFSVLCARLLLQAWAYSRAIISGSYNPVGVPTIETAVEQAAGEARSVSGAE